MWLLFVETKGYHFLLFIPLYRIWHMFFFVASFIFKKRNFFLNQRKFFIQWKHLHRQGLLWTLTSVMMMTKSSYCLFPLRLMGLSLHLEADKNKGEMSWMQFLASCWRLRIFSVFSRLALHNVMGFMLNFPLHYNFLSC